MKAGDALLAAAPTLLLLAVVALFACDPDALTAIPPEPDGGPVAEEGTRWRTPLPEEPPVNTCGLAIIWPLEEAPQGQCEPGWIDTCTGTGASPTLPTPTDTNCDGINDDECRPWAIILAIDGSGSMDPWRYEVEQALCALSGRQDALRSLVVFGDRWDDHARLIAPWGTRLCSMWPRTAGPEWAGEAGAMAPELVGGWPEGHARMLVIVTDEPPQGSGIDDGLDLLRTACLGGGFRVGVITRTAHQSRWSAVVSQCDGFIAQLNEEPLYPMSGAEPPCTE